MSVDCRSCCILLAHGVDSRWTTFGIEAAAALAATYWLVARQLSREYLAVDRGVRYVPGIAFFCSAVAVSW